MSLEIITLKEADRWDKIVKSFNDHDVYYLSGYLKSLEINGDGEPLLFYCQTNDGRGINVVLKRDVSTDKKFTNLEKNKYFDFTTPYGYGGWILEGIQDSDFFKEYEGWCKDNNIICEFVRFHPLIENQKYSENSYDVIPLGQVISMDCNSYDIMWSNMSSRNRNKIKKAINNNIKVEIGFVEKLDTFIRIYEETMDRDNAEDYYYFKKDYYDCLFSDLKNNVLVFSATLDNETLSSCIIFKANGRLSYHLSGSTRGTANLYETNLLLYSVAKWGAENGYKSFLLGGGVGSKEDNLYNFKKGFDDKHSYQFYIGKKIYNDGLYNELVNKRNNIENPGFFPKYRG